MRKKVLIKKHPIKPDKKYDSEIISRLINKIMKGGEKRIAKRIVYQSAQLIEKSTSLPFLTIFNGALVNIKPRLETKTRKMGSSKQRIPVKIEERRAIMLALKWLVKGAERRKPAKSMFEKLAEEIQDAFNKSDKSEAYKKKENVHKEAMSNMAFAGSSIEN